MLPANASGQPSPRSAGRCEHRPRAVSAVRRQCDGDASGVARPSLPIGPPTARRRPRALVGVVHVLRGFAVLGGPCWSPSRMRPAMPAGTTAGRKRLG